ncbi:MAG: hypothetical protein LCH52_03875 [Bacteroidetes bacterium]|nr:hypothetical protein [Bacteroidota bacterium]
MKIEVWSNKLNKMVQFETQQELVDSEEFSEWIDEQLVNIYMEYKIDPDAPEEDVREFFINGCWELNGNGGNTLYPNLKNPADFCWSNFKRDHCIEQDRLYVKSAHSGTSEEEIAKAIVLAENDGNVIYDGTYMKFSDMNYRISVEIYENDEYPHEYPDIYTIYDGNPKEHECDCEGIWNDDGEWECECECEDEDDTWEMTDEQVQEILKDYRIIWM